MASPYCGIRGRPARCRPRTGQHGEDGLASSGARRRRPPRRPDGPVLTLTINRPERRNAMTWEVIADLRREVARPR